MKHYYAILLFCLSISSHIPAVDNIPGLANVLLAAALAAQADERNALARELNNQRLAKRERKAERRERRKGLLNKKGQPKELYRKTKVNNGLNFKKDHR